MSERYTYAANNILKRLVFYLNGGAKSPIEQKVYERILNVLDQLTDEELRYVKAKYIDLITPVEGTQIIRLPTVQEIRNYLNISGKELKLLTDKTNKKVVEYHRKLVEEECEAEIKERKKRNRQF